MNNTKAIVFHSLNTAAERYSSNTLLRASVTLVPWVGGSLDAILTTRASEIAYQRINSFIDDLRMEFAELSEEVIDRSFLDSEDWLAAVTKAFEVASREKDREMIKQYARILCAAATGPIIDAPDPATLLAVVSELTVHEIVLARLISNLPANPHSWDKFIAQVPETTAKNLVFHLKRLERTGLIAEDTGSYMGYAGGHYSPTPTLIRIMAYLCAKP